MQVYSQFGPQQIISTAVPSSSSVITADLDGDGDIDVISRSYQDQKIAWYENTDGRGSFGAMQVIVQNADEYATAVSASDLDGDGAIDLLSAFDGEFPGVSKIAWNKNLDGLGNFGPQQIISFDHVSVWTIIGTDIDNDSDLDILIIDRNQNQVAWFENLDGLGNFGPEITISTNLDWPIFGVVGDIDNDGDIDILTHSYDGNNIGWFENLNGQGSFSDLQIISTAVDQPFQVFLADIDMDNDLDVISTSLNDNKVAWYENTDGQGAFGPQLIISTDIIYPYTLFVQDLDNDDDMDIFSSYSDDFMYGIVWFENLDGTGTFSAPKLISDEVSYPTSVFASDLDQDQDIDVLSSSFHDYKIAWYENQTILNSPDFKKPKSIFYPNPVSQTLYINSEETIQTIKIFNNIGQLVKLNSNSNKIRTEDIQSGFYLVYVYYENGLLEKHKLIKE